MLLLDFLSAKQPTMIIWIEKLLCFLKNLIAIFTQSSEEKQYYQLKRMYEEAKTVEEYKRLIQQLVQAQKNHENLSEWWKQRTIFVEQFGYGIPSTAAIELIYKWYFQLQSQNKNLRFVDFGCGSGIWTFLLCERGINANNIIAIDLPSKKKKNIFAKLCWQIYETENFEIRDTDVIFISWGNLNDEVWKSIEEKAMFIIILGDNGCTFPPPCYFYKDKMDMCFVNEKQKKWVNVDMCEVPGNMSRCDYLSLNVHVNKVGTKNGN